MSDGPLPTKRARTSKAPTSKAPATAAPRRAATPGLALVGQRNLQSEIQKHFSTSTVLIRNGPEFSATNLKPVANGTIKVIAHTKKMWLDAFTAIYQDEEKAKSTLAKGAYFPEPEAVKFFLWFVSTRGHSSLGLPDVPDTWGLVTATAFLERICIMLRHHETIPPTPDDRAQLRAALKGWVVEDKALHISARPKHILLEQDLVELLAVVFHNALSVKQYFTRIQYAALFLFFHDWHKEKQCLQWKDLEFVIDGWEEGVGCIFHVQINFCWLKGGRLEVLTTSMHTLGRSKLHLDCIPYLLAMGTFAGVFTENIWDYISRQKTPAHYPYKLKTTQQCQDLPVWVNATARDTPLHLDSVEKTIVLLRNLLGWPEFRTISLHYLFATTMGPLLPAHHFKYLMGHAPMSFHGFLTYAMAEHPVDVMAGRFREIDTNFIDRTRKHAAVSWNRAQVPQEFTATDDSTLQELFSESTENFIACSLAVNTEIMNGTQLLEAYQNLSSEELQSLVGDTLAPVLECLADIVAYVASMLYPCQPRSIHAPIASGHAPVTPELPVFPDLRSLRIAITLSPSSGSIPIPFVPCNTGTSMHSPPVLPGSSSTFRFTIQSLQTIN
ncbi:hypothetical protein C8F01DRAFT_1256121 [Mycena amicta]|nr:hypothetical protein C8F01DRAFT_1256121 [Mycena amicta]